MASKKKDNLDKKQKKTNIFSKRTEDTEEFSLSNIIELGGDEADYNLLKDVDTKTDLETGEIIGDEQVEVNKVELKQMITNLGLQSIKNQVVFEPSEKGDPSHKKNKFVSDKTKKGNSGFVETQVSLNKTQNKADENETINVALKDRLLVRPSGRWYDASLVDSSSKKAQNLDSMYVDKMQKIAESLWENEIAVYKKERQKSKSSDLEWLKTMANSGTLGDKIASLAIQIQESPVHHLKTLDILLGMANKKGRRECLMAIDTLKDLLLVNLLPDGRKLRHLREFPLTEVTKKTNQSGRDARDRKLILWYFEDQLKKRYEAFVTGMERLLHDNLENIRSKMLGIVYELLSEKPEQEKTLLLYLVNKVGDPNRKIASKTGHLLGCLVQKHPNMKMVITHEVERLLYRPNIGLKAQYYAVCFLNQLILTKRDSILASQLITIYFSLFKAFVDRGQVESKMLSALLSGVNRAFHYVQDDEDRFSEQINMLFRVVHITPFNTSLQALMLLFQVMDSRQSISDRYYQALYAKLLDSHLRLSSKQAMFLNVIYKSLKVDPSLKRLKAFVKRLLQVCSTQQPSFVCGVLYLLSEVGKIKPGMKGLVSQHEDLDEDEHFTDVVDTTEDAADCPAASSDVVKETGDDIRTSPPAHGHIFIKNASRTQGYQANARNPLYSGAEDSCLWEVIKLTNHYHPSVSRFAECLLQGDNITYDGDPLLDFTLMRFLDRFVYKNPKKKAQEHGGSLMQPKSVSQRNFEQPVNSAAFLNKREENVREDEVFFYRYFKRKVEQEGKKENKNKKNEMEEEIEEGDPVGFGNTDVSMDFAREFEKSQKNKPKKKKKRDSLEESDEELSDDGDFNYEEMDLSEDDLPNDSPGERKLNYTDKDYEKALLDNLSSDEFSESEKPTSTTKKRKKFESSEDLSMFAAAEEFAHLLEGSRGDGGGGSDDIDMKGASLKQQQWELSRMGDSSNDSRIRKKRNRGNGEYGKRKGNNEKRKNTQRKRQFKRK